MFETDIGIGYAYTKYEKYHPQDGHYLYQQTNRTYMPGISELEKATFLYYGTFEEFQHNYYRSANAAKDPKAYSFRKPKPYPCHDTYPFRQDAGERTLLGTERLGKK